MNKPTPGPWGIAWGIDHITGQYRYSVVAYGGDPTSEKEASANAALIVAAVNSCFQVSPDNPLAVAEGMAEVVEAAKASESFLKDLVGRPRIGFDLDPTLERLATILAKLGAK